LSNSDILKSLYTALASDDVKAAAQYLDPKLVLHMPLQKDYVEDFLSFFRDVKASFPDVAYNLEITVEQAELVAESVTMTGTLSGAPFHGLPADSSKVQVRSVTISRIADGRIAERWETTTGWP
jgi:predicted ester cyclase